MHSSSESIGAIATALAKAQAELTNPEKTLTATIMAANGERTFRYASLATGLDLIRKCLGQHQIAVVQTTAVNQGQILLTTLLVHASGEWVSSLWPVCAAAVPSAHVKGAALTYARRYALFTLVGIAGEDDLDAPPEIALQPEQPRPEQTPLRKAGNGNVHSPRPQQLPPDKSALLRERLLKEISILTTDDALALWAHRSLSLKNTLTQEDSLAVEAAYLAKVAKDLEQGDAIGTTPDVLQQSPHRGNDRQPISANEEVWPIAKTVRKRSKAHLAFVASQPCLICKASPSPSQDRPASIVGAKGER
jgi:ERF superfamily